MFVLEVCDKWEEGYIYQHTERAEPIFFYKPGQNMTCLGKLINVYEVNRKQIYLSIVRLSA